jgi:hypothetical protein
LTGRFVGLALTACIVISLLPMAGALDVDIGRPADGALLGSKSVHVNGTCSGAEMTAWTTAAPAGFQNGTADNIGLAPDGALTFPPEISDDFNGSGLNSSMWDSQPEHQRGRLHDLHLGRPIAQR